MNTNNKLKFAHALNILMVSISQILDFNDINIMKQEYDVIINNFKFGSLSKDKALSKVLQNIKETIHCLIAEKEDNEIYWLKKAANQQCKKAQYRLGECYCCLGDCYRDGIGVEKDFEAASSWYKKAVKTGDFYTAGRACVSHLELLSLALKDFQNKQRELEPMKKEVIESLKELYG